MSGSLHFVYSMGCEESVMEVPENEYDSTWDDEHEDQQFSMRKVNKQQTWRAPRNQEAALDMQNFRHRCQNNRHYYHASPSEGYLHNYNFYQNKTPSRPDGVYIKEIHERWFGDYSRLERVHSYIQWLFPTQEPGVNYSTHVLTPTEIMYFCKDNVVQKRLLKSYKLMLDFYGIQLVNEETGQVQRANNWKERFENLNRNTHNNLRITRILKCLGLLGLHRFQAPLVHFFLEETLVKGTLSQVKQSILDYFMFAVLDKSERKKLIEFAFYNFEPKELFVWCPRRIQRKLMKRISQKGRPLQTLAGARREVMLCSDDYKKRYKVSPYSPNSSRNQYQSSSRVRSTDQHQIASRTPHPLVKNYTLV